MPGDIREDSLEAGARAESYRTRLVYQEQLKIRIYPRGKTDTLV